MLSPSSWVATLTMVHSYSLTPCLFGRCIWSLVVVLDCQSSKPAGVAASDSPHQPLLTPYPGWLACGRRQVHPPLVQQLAQLVQQRQQHLTHWQASPLHLRTHSDTLVRPSPCSATNCNMLHAGTTGSLHPAGGRSWFTHRLPACRRSPPPSACGCMGTAWTWSLSKRVNDSNQQASQWTPGDQQLWWVYCCWRICCQGSDLGPHRLLGLGERLRSSSPSALRSGLLSLLRLRSRLRSAERSRRPPGERLPLYHGHSVVLQSADA